MVEETLEIKWTNRDEPRATKRYKVLFLPYGPDFQPGAQAYKEFVGEESLAGYFVDLQAPTMTIDRRSVRAQQWLSDVTSAGHLSLHNTQLNDQQFAPFRRAS